MRAALRHVKEGQPAWVAFQSAPGEVFTARVTSIGRGVASGQGVPSGRLPEVQRQASWVPLAQRFQVRLDPRRDRGAAVARRHDGERIDLHRARRRAQRRDAASPPVHRVAVLSLRRRGDSRPQSDDHERHDHRDRDAEQTLDAAGEIAELLGGPTSNNGMTRPI